MSHRTNRGMKLLSHRTIRSACVEGYHSTPAGCNLPIVSEGKQSHRPAIARSPRDDAILLPRRLTDDPAMPRATVSIVTVATPALTPIVGPIRCPIVLLILALRSNRCRAAVSRGAVAAPAGYALAFAVLPMIP